ncbi:hypothetical protein ELH17_08305 [Rhizobium ruizarguesonis]|nr:hypothetical protein ELH17_08305 [Rhizobium ruizarguesonis]
MRCQEAIGDAFASVADAAASAGWTPEEVASALVELADNHMLALLSNRDVARQLSFLRKP